MPNLTGVEAVNAPTAAPVDAGRITPSNINWGGLLGSVGAAAGRAFSTMGQSALGSFQASLDAASSQPSTAPMHPAAATAVGNYETSTGATASGAEQEGLNTLAGQTDNLRKALNQGAISQQEGDARRQELYNSFVRTHPWLGREAHSMLMSSASFSDEMWKRQHSVQVQWQETQHNMAEKMRTMALDNGHMEVANWDDAQVLTGMKSMPWAQNIMRAKDSQTVLSGIQSNGGIVDATTHQAAQAAVRQAIPGVMSMFHSAAMDISRGPGTPAEKAAKMSQLQIQTQGQLNDPKNGLFIPGISTADQKEVLDTVSMATKNYQDWILGGNESKAAENNLTLTKSLQQYDVLSKNPKFTQLQMYNEVVRGMPPDANGDLLSHLYTNAVTKSGIFGTAFEGLSGQSQDVYSGNNHADPKAVSAAADDSAALVHSGMDQWGKLTPEQKQFSTRYLLGALRSGGNDGSDGYMDKLLPIMASANFNKTIGADPEFTQKFQGEGERHLGQWLTHLGQSFSSNVPTLNGKMHFVNDPGQPLRLDVNDGVTPTAAELSKLRGLNVRISQAASAVSNINGLDINKGNEFMFNNYLKKPGK